MKALAVVVDLAVCVCLCSCAKTNHSGVVNGGKNQEAVHGVNAIVNYVGRRLNISGNRALIEYGGTCIKKYGAYTVHLPAVKVQLPPDSAAGLSAIRQIFRKDENVTIKQASDGVIKIVIGKVWRPILRVSVSRVVLSDDIERYEAFAAIRQIVGTKEVRSAMKKLNAQHPILALSPLFSPPQKEKPHLPRLIRNMTVIKYLQLVAKTFNGIVVYSTCTKADGTHLFDINFFRVATSPG